jgi:hypothetical protein
MLTKEEKKFLEAIREQLDDDQKADFDAMSDEEKKELLKQTNKIASNPKTRIQIIREMSCWEFVKGYGHDGPIGAALVWLIIRMTATKKGCLTLLIIVGVLLIIGVIGANV